MRTGKSRTLYQITDLGTEARHSDSQVGLICKSLCVFSRFAPLGSSPGQLLQPLRLTLSVTHTLPFLPWAHPLQLQPPRQLELLGSRGEISYVTVGSSHWPREGGARRHDVRRPKGRSGEGKAEGSRISTWRLWYWPWLR